MPIKTPTPTQAQVDELRNRFLEKYQKNPPPGKFHDVDVDRVKSSDLWCIRFLEMYDLDINLSFDKLWETCIWRQEYGANDLDENNLRKEYVTDGVVFTRNKDVDGKPLLIFRTKLHTKGTKDMNEVMRVVVYWIERIHRETNMEKITVFFDMDGTGMSNMDLDFVKRTIEIFKQYYPNALNYILVFELAWILNAAFKVVKNLLPAKALEILKMISKKDVNTYIDKNNCLKSWGGNDDYQFTFVPETKKTTPKVNGTSPTKETENHVNNNNNIDHQQNGDKQVRFANSSPDRWPKHSDIEDFHYSDEDTMLHITPNDFLTFSQGENSDTIVDITCSSNFPVMFKIQTTSPEKFRVRPRFGVLKPNQSVGVNILLKAEHRLAESAKDKFLVMCMPAPADLDASSPQQITDVWKQKQINSPDVEQHRLCCQYINSEPNRQAGAAGQQGAGNLDAKSTGNISELAKHAKKMEKQLNFTQTLQYVTLFFILILSMAVMYLLRLEMDSGAIHSPASGKTLLNKRS